MSNLRSTLPTNSHSEGEVVKSVAVAALLCFDMGVATRVAEQAHIASAIIVRYKSLIVVFVRLVDGKGPFPLQI